jgi:uncharacterized RDD family membrane protein YckC
MELSLAASSETVRPVTGKGFWVRAGAYVLDVIALWITSVVISVVVGIFLGFAFAVMGRELVFAEGQMRPVDLLIGAISSTLYFIAFEWLYGATPGKLILGMRVIMESGRNCTLGAACIRALLRYIDGLIFAIPAYVSMKEPLLQRIGDKAARTIVVGAKDQFIQRAREWWWFAVAAAIYLGIEVVAALVQTISLLR